MIIEQYLPFDYFAMMIGVLVDQKVFMKFLQCDFKDIYKQFHVLGFDPSVLFVQWFLCIFTYNMPELVIIFNFLLFSYRVLYVFWICFSFRV